MADIPLTSLSRSCSIPINNNRSLYYPNNLTITTPGFLI